MRSPSNRLRSVCETKYRPNGMNSISSPDKGHPGYSPGRRVRPHRSGGSLHDRIHLFGLLSYCFLVVGTSDNILKPIILKKAAPFHPMIAFSAIGRKSSIFSVSVAVTYIIVSRKSLVGDGRRPSCGTVGRRGRVGRPLREALGQRSIEIASARRAMHSQMEYGRPRQPWLAQGLRAGCDKKGSVEKRRISYVWP